MADFSLRSLYSLSVFREQLVGFTMATMGTVQGLCLYAAMLTAFTVYSLAFRVVYAILRLPGLLERQPFVAIRHKLEDFETRRNRLITTKPEQWMHKIGTWPMWKSVALNLWDRAFISNMSVGDKAVDVPLFQLHKDGSTSDVRLLDFAKPGRLLVVNFGSCTWPSFFDNLRQFGGIVDGYKNVADFVMIYIKEMHPDDEWVIDKGPFSVAQPSTNEERFAAAKNVQELGIDCPLLIDPISNRANILYKAMPEKVYIFKEGRIVFRLEDGPFFYDLDLVQKFLEKATKTD